MTAVAPVPTAPTAPSRAAPTTVLRQLHALGKSIWLDNISRALIRSGELKALADEGLLGVPPNPTIFEKAITAGVDYDDQLAAAARQTSSAAQVFEALA